MPHQKTTSPTQATSGVIRPDETLRVRTIAPTAPTTEATRMYMRLPWSDRVASGRRLLDPPHPQENPHDGTDHREHACRGWRRRKGMHDGDATAGGWSPTGRG